MSKVTDVSGFGVLPYYKKSTVVTLVTPELDAFAFAMPADNVPVAPAYDAPAAPIGSLHLVTTTNASPAFVLHFKLPTFSTVDAEIWFCHAKVQFRLQKVRSCHTQADHVLAAIPDTIFPQMSTWLDSKGDDVIEY